MTPKTIKEYEELTGAEALTPAERWLIEKCRAGMGCRLGETVPAQGTPDNTIRASLLRLLITGGSPDCGLHETGVYLEGSWIEGPLNLSFTRARGRTVLDKCHFAEKPQMEQAELQLVSLDGSHLPGLWAQGVKVTGTLFLRSVKASGTVDVTGADIGGQLACDGATFDGMGGEALNAQGVKVGADLFLGSAKASGTVAVNGADIGGQLGCDGATFDGKGGKALNAQGVKVKADLFLRSVKASGTVAANGADIGGQLSCTGATFDGKGGKALNAQGVKVKASLFLSSITASGTVNVNGAEIGGQLACDGATFDGKGGMALIAQRLRVAQGFIWLGVKSVTGAVSLDGAHVSDLVDDLKSWPDKSNQLLLDGFTYDRIAAGPTSAAARLPWLRLGANFGGTFYPQPYTQLAKMLADMGHVRDARAVRMAAIRDGAAHLRQNRRAHRRLARALRRVSRVRTRLNIVQLKELLTELPGAIQIGAGPTAENFLRLHSPEPRPEGAPPPLSDLTRQLAQQQFRNDMWMRAVRCRLRIAGNWAGDLCMRAFVGYGHAPQRALYWSLAFIGLSAALYGAGWQKGVMVPNSDVILTSPDWSAAMEQAPEAPAQAWLDLGKGSDWKRRGSPHHYETFYSLAYATDVFVPLVDLGQESAWAATTVTGFGFFIRWFTFILEIVGWVITALGAAAITGIIQRGRD